MLLNPILAPSVHDPGPATEFFSLLPGVFASIVDKDKCDEDSCYLLLSICDPCVLAFFFHPCLQCLAVYSSPTDTALSLAVAVTPAANHHRCHWRNSSLIPASSSCWGQSPSHPSSYSVARMWLMLSFAFLRHESLLPYDVGLEIPETN